MSSNNLIIQQKIVTEVCSLISKSREHIIEIGPLEINSFSICFWIDFREPLGNESIYVKIPKIIFYNKNKENLENITEEDRSLALYEFESLKYLQKFWDTQYGVHFVELYGYLRKYNALVTRRIDGKFLFNEIRLHDKSKILKKEFTSRIENVLFKLGSSLKNFHKLESEEERFLADESELKFQKYLNNLRQFGVNETKLSLIEEQTTKLYGFYSKSTYVNNLKGIDIRQIFLKDEELHIIDPGKLSKGFPEIDIARFVVTCRILYWGTISILRGTSPSLKYENSFLEGYYGSDIRPHKMLKLLVIKEILKHWSMAHLSLTKRKWNLLVKYFLKKAYIDYFYYKLIIEEMYD